jgi:Na+/H+ antiporter NhaD/arsenite permease-like protein
MDSRSRPENKRDLVPAAILAIIIAYAIALCVGWPQSGTRQIIAQHAQLESSHATPSLAQSIAIPPSWTVLPFVLLLAGIAVLPLMPATSHWWESNLNLFKVAGGLALLTMAYYAFLHRGGLEGHWPAHHVVIPTNGSMQTGLVNTILANAMLQEFVPFIVLLFSLYTISGGIRIAGDLEARPATNATFMGVGALLASLIGTTGAAMLLIRPLLETNRERKHVAHTVVIFIFIVCNCGGCLLPIGDPPLFLGYLEGVPFLWTLRLWPQWLFVNGLLIVAYLLLDALWFYRHELKADIQRDVRFYHRLRFSGWRLNAPLLIGVVLAVALLDPSKPFVGTNWHPWMYLREVVQLCLAGVSLSFGNRQVRDANLFTYGAIIEVAALFVGIFICMQPALQILGSKGSELGLTSPAHFFWASGSLSSVLDNAPTYLVFFKTAQSLGADSQTATVAGVHPMILAAISLGSVFMGAMTYIGNGPNFMVRSIAESAGIKMPSFFGYMVYSCLILLPILALMVWQFLM